MSRNRLPALLLALVASACVSITPRVGSVAPATVTPSASSPLATTPIVADPSPTVEPTTESTPTQTPTPEPTAEPTDTTTPRPTESPTAASPGPELGSSNPACSDDTFRLTGYSWQGPYEWRFNADSTPSGYRPNAVLNVIKTGVANITAARNDCGLPDEVAAQAVYLGPTEVEPCTDEGDGVNVIGFGRMPRDLGVDLIAVTCPYTFIQTDEIAEADVIISEDIDWALSLDTCSGMQELLESTVTHELGHVFGLAHVSERRHGDLTMSPRSNGPCDDSESSLGLGDVLGLEELYGTP